jgi:hypothetical protein
MDKNPEAPWLQKVIAEFGRPEAERHEPNEDAWAWFPDIDDGPTSHVVKIQRYGAFTTVEMRSNIGWKASVKMEFTQGIGPTDRDFDMMLDISQFLRFHQRFAPSKPIETLT